MAGSSPSSRNRRYCSDHTGRHRRSTISVSAAKNARRPSPQMKMGLARLRFTRASAKSRMPSPFLKGSAWSMSLTLTMTVWS
jgi:hypothetical protein